MTGIVFCSECGGYHAPVKDGYECGYVKKRRETGNPNWPRPAPDEPDRDPTPQEGGPSDADS